jgi:dipeptidase E
MPLRLALYSDQECPENRPMDERLLTLMGVPNPEIGYISSEPDPQRIYFARKCAYYAELGVTLRHYVDAETASPSAIAALLQCDAVHLSGGNTFVFSRWLERAGLFEPLREYAQERGVLIGASAGAILLTDLLATATLCGDVADDPSEEYNSLGLVHFGFWPHYLPDEALMKKVAVLLEKSSYIYACQDGSGLIIDGHRLEQWGKVSPLIR